jgi:hypothetical protein
LLDRSITEAMSSACEGSPRSEEAKKKKAPDVIVGDMPQ